MDLFMKQGCVSKVTIVYDRQNFSMSQHLDKPLLKGLASLFSDNFPESLHAAYLYPCGFVLRGIWAVVQYFFDVIVYKFYKNNFYILLYRSNLRHLATIVKLDDFLDNFILESCQNHSLSHRF